MIVHDLRSPLSSVMASIDMLIRGISGDLNQPQHHVLNIAYSSSLQMLEMINTLLDISRLEAGRIPLKLSSHQISPLAQRAIERLGSLAQDRAMLIQTDIPSDLDQVLIDDEMIVRVLQNPLGNALNFSGRGSTVLIQATSGARKPHEIEAGGQNGASDPMRFVTVAVSDRGGGDRAKGSGQDLYQVRPGRRAQRRDRPRPHLLQAGGRDPRRRDLGREPARPRQHLLLHPARRLSFQKL